MADGFNKRYLLKFSSTEKFFSTKSFSLKNKKKIKKKYPVFFLIKSYH